MGKLALRNPKWQSVSTLLSPIVGCQSQKQKWNNMLYVRQYYWFILWLLLVSRKRNWYSASNSIGLIFTRSYGPMLLIMTPTSSNSDSAASVNHLGSYNWKNITTNQRCFVSLITTLRVIVMQLAPHSNY